MAYFESTKLKDKEGNLVSPSSEDTLTLLKRIFYLLKPLGQVTGSGSNRLSVDVNSGSVAISSGTVTTVSTVTTVTTVTGVTTVGSLTNAANIGGVAGFDIMKAASRTAYNTGPRSNIS